GSVGDTAHLMAAPGVAGKFVVLDVPQGFDRRAIGPLLGRYHEASTIGIVALDQLGTEQIARIREGRPVSDTTRNPRAIALVWLDSLRPFNRVGRPMGADSPNRPATDAEQVRIRAILDSLRAIRPPRRDSIRNGADDDGSGTVAILEIAEAFATAQGAERPRR